MKLIDSRGETCPVPVIMLKKALKETSDENIRQIVDNKLAKENLEKMLSEMNIDFVSKQENDDYIVEVNLVGLDMSGAFEAEKSGDVVVISSDKMGEGSDELGKVLMKNFFFALTESDILPSKIIMYNSGVKLASENEDAIIDLKKLDEMGVEILVCGLCLNFFGLEKSLKVGTVSNMYSIVQSQINASKTINP